VLEVADRATILRDGANVTVVDVADTTLDELIRHMVGRELKEKFPRSGCRWAAKCCASNT
jgi:ribose transport system ATP-binding protein